MHLAISFLRHYFSNTFLLCDFVFICVSLQTLKTATGCEFHCLEMQLDFIFQNGVTAIYQLTNLASFFFFNLYFELSYFANDFLY